MFSRSKDGLIIEATAKVVVEDRVAIVYISGNWLTSNARTNIGKVTKYIGDGIDTLKFDTTQLGKFDSALICLLLRCYDLCIEHKIKFTTDGLTKGAKSLLNLATAVPEADTKGEDKKSDIISAMGLKTLGAVNDAKDQVSFIGEVAIAFAKACIMKARFRFSDLMLIIQRSGPDAFPIVMLMNFLFGLIIAFVSVTQLAKYGSQMFVADLVALAMTREMGAIMVGIIMAGRTGAAFSAELGTMKVNEEISAFRTFGISPIEFLVVPRMIALIAMFPLLTIFADVIGIMGGFVVGVGMFDLTTETYWNRTIGALNLTHISLGLGKSLIFGVIVATVGCLKGMRCGNSSSAVGLCTTESVVTSIKLIIVADGIFAIICYIFNI